MAGKQKWLGLLAMGMGLMMIGTWSEPVSADVSGSQVYKKACKKCHGKLGLGKKRKSESAEYKYPPIYALSEDDLMTALIKYRELWQEKTYNKREKKMAKPASRLSDEDLKAVAAFITSQLGPAAE